MTTRFGLAKWGGLFGGSAADNGYQASTADPETIDRILSALELHRHDAPLGAVALADPAAAPTAAIAPALGLLDPATAYTYRVAYEDRYGLLTAASDDVTIVTPSTSSVEDPLIATATTGGTLEEGVWEYALTAITQFGESTLGEPVLITLLGDMNSVTLDLPLLPLGGLSYSVWRQGPTEFAWTRIASGQAGATTITDSGIPSDPQAGLPGHTPPDEAEGANIYAVTVSLPAEDLTRLSDIVAWRLYRTETEGVWPEASLVARVITTDEIGTTSTSYTDDGDPLLPGVPPQISQTLTPSLQVLTPSGTVLPATVENGAQFLLLPAGVLHVGVNGAWQPVEHGVELIPSGTVLPVEVADGAQFLLMPDGILHIGANGAWAPVKGGTSEPATETILTAPNGSTYRLTVADDGTLGTELVTAAPTMTAPLAAPTMLRAAAISGTLKASWDPYTPTDTEDLTGYTVSITGQPDTVTTDPTHTVTGLADGLYDVTVAATSTTYGDGPATGPISVPLNPQTPVTGVTAFDGGGGLAAATWDTYTGDTTGLDGYSIFLDGTWVDLVPLGTTDWSRTVPNGSHTITVAVSNDAGYGPQSDMAMFDMTTGGGSTGGQPQNGTLAPATAVTGLSVTDSGDGNTAIATWDAYQPAADEDVQGYSVFVDGFYSTGVDISQTSIDVWLGAGTFSVQVAVTGNVGDGPLSDPVSVTIAAPGNTGTVAPTTAPTGLTATDSGSQRVDLTWDPYVTANPDEDWHFINVYEDGVLKTQKNASDVSASFTTLNPGEHSYQIAASGDFGDGPLSDPLLLNVASASQAGDFAPLYAPDYVNAKSDDPNEIAIRWPQYYPEPGEDFAGWSVYIDGTKVVTTNAITTYTNQYASAGEHTVGVAATGAYGDGPITTVTVNVSA